MPELCGDQGRVCRNFVVIRGGGGMPEFCGDQGGGGVCRNFVLIRGGGECRNFVVIRDRLGYSDGKPPKVGGCW